VFSDQDSFDLHIKDTLDAGDGLCNKEVAQMVVENGPDSIKELVKQGASFNKEGEGEFNFSLGQEGGHSAKRIVFAHDLTGKEIEDTLPMIKKSVFLIIVNRFFFFYACLSQR